MAGLRLGPHSGHESWPPPCLGGAVWSGSLENHFGGRLGESSGELWGARGGQVELCLGNDLESTLEAPFDHFTMTTWRRHNHNPRCRYKKTFKHWCKSDAKSKPVYGHDAKLICCTFAYNAYHFEYGSQLLVTTDVTEIKATFCIFQKVCAVYLLQQLSFVLSSLPNYW